ncbi:hypothetical protein BU204_11600 [Actinophytocola xanthii]|uniref:Uncharacterized protein n=1 Tax=Actinophytocola xanthii TaxID=1912961 RepID=A0A1Q8CSU2_9PSEU|nr:hypothetical protein BU204_11600 [Actinophytocola xanthii]
MSNTERTTSHMIVPYVTQWTAEQDGGYELVERESIGLAYADENIMDRDEHGVLWRRTPSRPGHGRPIFGMVHSLRQRRAMRRLLCQVCGEPASWTEDGVLWLLRDFRDDWPNWPENLAATEPPVCTPCAHKAVRLCPALRKGAAVIRVGRCPIVGVYGALYRVEGRRIITHGDESIAYDDPSIRWMRATKLVRELHDCTLVTLDGLPQT